MTEIEPFVVVVGATGQQGGACVEALLQQNKFKVKALTRNSTSAAAKALAARDVTLVTGDLKDKDSLIKAFTGAHGVFLVTDYFRSAEGRAEKEIEQGKNAIDAARQASVNHLVWSSLEDPRPIIKGALPEVEPGRIIPHWESKSEIAAYLKTSGVPYTVLVTSIFYDNAISGAYAYRQQQDGSCVFALNGGTKAHPGCSIEDIGASAAECKLKQSGARSYRNTVAMSEQQQQPQPQQASSAAANATLNTAELSQRARELDTAVEQLQENVGFDNVTSCIGATIPVVGEHISYAKISEVISKATGKTVKYHELTWDQMAQLPFPAAQEIANMLQYYNDFPDFADSRPLDKAVIKGNSFERWAEKHVDELRSAVAKAQ